MKKKITATVMAILLGAALTACSETSTISVKENYETAADANTDSSVAKTIENKGSAADGTSGKGSDSERSAGDETAVKASAALTSADDIDVENLLSDRDTDQSPDLTNAEELTLEDGKDITIDAEGIYVLSGTASNASVIINASEDDKVQLVLNGLNVTNENTPCIYAKQADKVFVTLAGQNSLAVTGEFTSDGDTNTDSVIFSKCDLTINGTGILDMESSDNAVAGKDTLKVTGGTVNISCSGSALESKDEILICDGTVNITNSNDGLHAEDDDDDTKGYIYIGGGTLNITAADDGIHATTVVRIDDVEANIKCAEGIEGTVICINGGNINIEASDDGINAAYKSGSLSPLFEMNGGNVTVKMADGDTDAIDSNGDIIINGGTIDITGRSSFDYDGKAEYNGGTIIVNGEETNTITNQMMGGRGGMNGNGEMIGGMNGNGDMAGGMNGNGDMAGGMNGNGEMMGGMNGSGGMTGGMKQGHGPMGGRGKKGVESDTTLPDGSQTPQFDEETQENIEQM